MALVLIETFDTCSTAAALGVKGWTVSLGPGGSLSGNGRFGGNALQIGNGSGQSNTSALKTLPSSYSTIFAGFAWQDNTAVASTGDLFHFRAGSTQTFRVFLTAGGVLAIRNSAGTVIATGTTVLSINVWYYIEVKCVIAGASGSCELHLNGVTEIASTTGNFGSSNIDHIACFCQPASHQERWDDMWVLDTTGSAPRNTFLGDVRGVVVLPSGAGAHTDWTANGAGSNYQCVDEATPNDDTDYVSDANPNDIDTYTFADIDGGASVFGVQANLYARKDDANVRQIANVIRQAGTDYVGNTVTLGSTYQYFSQIYNQDPTGSDWTAANLNADEFGVKEIA